MTISLKLYRGDKIWNSSEPGRYRFDGIRSKSFGKGRPQNIDPAALLSSIRQHINPVSPIDRAIYNATEFISFSSSRSRAIYWLSDQGSIKLLPAINDYEETRYMFEIEINTPDLIAIDQYETMYKYFFNCNYDLKSSNSSSFQDNLVFMATESGTYFKSCPVCNNKTTKSHAIVLIDAVKYLEHYKSGSAYEGAVVNAQNDMEWLILPVDKISDFSGTTIPRANFWKTEHFIGDNESRDPLMHQLSGMIYDSENNVM